jgi:hypothetical protein
MCWCPFPVVVRTDSGVEAGFMAYLLRWSSDAELSGWAIVLLFLDLVIKEVTRLVGWDALVIRCLDNIPSRSAIVSYIHSLHGFGLIQHICTTMSVRKT